MSKVTRIEPDFLPPKDEAEYDRWFRAKVEVALAETGPGIPHAEVVAHMKSRLAELRAKR